MTTDTAATLIILLAAPAATVFPIVYAITSPWWRSLLGTALLISSTGLALLIDVSLLYQWLGDDYYLRDVVRLSVFTIIAAGTWLKLTAYAWAKYAGRHDRRDRFNEGSRSKRDERVKRERKARR